MTLKKDLSHRIGLIDEIRGFAILCMVVYHAVYDAVFLFSVSIPAFQSPLMNLIRDIFAFGFIFISGASSRFSHSNLKRGAICFGIGIGMTIFTILFMKDQLIAFGILHCLGICMMAYPLFAKLLDKIPAPIGAALLAFLFILTCQISSGHLGIEGLLSFDLPDAPYQLGWLFPFGFPSDTFYSADYYPLLPWLFAFLLGSYFGRWLKNGNPPDWIRKTHLQPLAFIGRHTLWIYVLHQPVVYLTMSGIAYLLR